MLSQCIDCRKLHGADDDVCIICRIEREHAERNEMRFSAPFLTDEERESLDRHEDSIEREARGARNVMG